MATEHLLAQGHRRIAFYGGFQASSSCRQRRLGYAEAMAFYHPRAIDPAGGFFHYFRDDGTVYDREHRHLVSSTRFVFNYVMAAREFEQPEYLDAARWGLRYLREVHRNNDSGGYAWTIRNGGGPRTAATSATVSPSCCWRMPPRSRPASPKPRRG